MQMHGQPLYNKSAVKRRSTLGGLDQYTTPNTKYTGDECPPPQKKKQNQKKNNQTLHRCGVKFQTQQIHVATKIVTLWNSRTVAVKQSTINSPH